MAVERRLPAVRRDKNRVPAIACASRCGGFVHKIPLPPCGGGLGWGGCPTSDIEIAPPSLTLPHKGGRGRCFSLRQMRFDVIVGLRPDDPVATRNGMLATSASMTDWFGVSLPEQTGVALAALNVFIPFYDKQHSS